MLVAHERAPVQISSLTLLQFWQLPESVEDVFSLFSPADIRRIRDEAPGNLEKLVLAVTSRLFALRHDQAFPNTQSAPASEALNCIRVLTRVLPFIYEEERLERWEETFFWAPRMVSRKTRRRREAEVLFDGDRPEQAPPPEADEAFEDKPLAAELIDTLLDLLFFTNFTIPTVRGARSGVSLSIWQSGVGCDSDIGTTRELDSNKLEVLRLLLTLCSKSMYTSASSCTLESTSLPLLTNESQTSYPSRACKR